MPMQSMRSLSIRTDAESLSNANSFWGAYVAAVLASLEVGVVVISPGSRSTPLTFACARQEGLQCLSVLDERSAGFIALGAARASRRPSVLICTSGSAAAHYLPAVIEAHESGVPLIVLTADRPAEARFCRSGQTIDQQRIFGEFVCFASEWPLPEVTETSLRYLRQSLVHAVERCCSPAGGVVHINCPFRDPLAPTPGAGANILWENLSASLWLKPSIPRSASLISRSFPGIAGSVIVVAGGADPVSAEDYALSVFELAKHWQAPVLADVLSPLRHHASLCKTVLVTSYDSVVRKLLNGDIKAPDISSVVVINELPTSKLLRRWLGQLQVPFYWLSERLDNRDPLHAHSEHIRSTPCDWLRAIETEGSPEIRNAELLDWWKGQEEYLLNRYQEKVTQNRHLGLTEPMVIPIIANLISADSLLILASSMPVRDAEYFWPPSSSQLRVLANRGANGIDGTVSSAIGAALGGQPVVVLVGDLAFLHDTNALLSLAKLPHLNLTIVVINNEGGGIFGHLPVAEFDPPFREFFLTPQKVDIAQLCKAYDIRHNRIQSAVELEQAFAAALSGGIQVLEVACERKQAIDYRKSVL
ncbi:MAG: 2-succinyl-5-enolpyruvyl-6-hydroxy-3-cyclohexene-1-carboxylic-acid synthase [Verrucomicrobia bacterium]|nr:2-succinyl-5-enolpyruvyl-6-hydroxy-3-cyclohexene-1-carboxylic-acid synthase [Verrucomicrobiota bacterium]